MKKFKKILSILMAASLMAGLTACGSATETDSAAVADSDEESAAEATAEEQTAKNAEKEDAEKETAAAGLPAIDEITAEITLADGAVTVSGSGVSVTGSTVNIEEEGTYRIAGTLTDGQISVNCDDEGSVILILDGADIANLEDAAIYCKDTAITEIYLAPGSENRIQSGTEVEIEMSRFTSEDEDASGGAITVKDDLIIDGEGSLFVYGYINNGIHCSDNLTIEGGTIDVTAVHHGIKGNDSATFCDGIISVTSVRDGIHSDGTVTITGGDITIATADDGIHADSEIAIEDGDIAITQSYEGIEANQILIAGGNVTVIASDDGINANGGSRTGFGGPGGMLGTGDFQEVFEKIFGSDFDISEIFGDGSELPGGFAGDLELPEDFEMPEGFADRRGGRDGQEGGMGRGGFGGGSGMPEGFAGDFELPEDFEMPEGRPERGGFGDGSEMPEGMEDRRGDRDSSEGRMGGREDFQNRPDSGQSSDSEEDLPVLRITGGTVTVTARGDGLDSNGSLYVEGGLIVVNGPSDNGNGALDYGSENGGECLITGGTVLAVGSSGMAETFGEDSEQCSFLCNLSSSFKEGDELTVTAQDGTVLFTHTIEKTGNSVVFSSPDLRVGDTVTLTVGDQTEEITLDSQSNRSGSVGGMGGFFRR